MKKNRTIARPSELTVDKRHPSEFTRRILIAVTGLSPQIITETLYVLAVRNNPPFVPTEIHLITTTRGSEEAKMNLIEGDKWIQRLCEDYGLADIAFEKERIKVLSGEDGCPLEDIRTLSDNRAAANQISEYIRHLTSDPESAIHASIAGGRKTMGFFLGYAISLYGRTQDRLSHVLVSTPYESDSKFFYPLPDNSANNQNVEVTLANIDFVRLRGNLPVELLANQEQFESIVDAAQVAIRPAELIIDKKNKCIMAAGVVIKFPPLQLAFLLWFANKCKIDENWLRCPSEGVPDEQYAEEFLREYRKIIGELGNDDRTKKRLENGMTSEFFSQTKSKTHGILRKHLSEVQLAPYLIARKKSENVWKYGLSLDPNYITFANIRKSQPYATREVQKTTTLTKAD